jgi:hypothetical protein
LSAKKSTYSLSEGSLVLVQDENRKRLQWDLGKVVKVFKGRDGLIRAAEVKTKSTGLVRPVQRLLLLDLDQDKEQAIEDFEVDNASGIDPPPAASGIRTPTSTDVNNTSVQTRSGRVVKKKEVLDL